MMRHAGCGIVLLAWTLFAPSLRAGMLETCDEANSIEFSSSSPPSIFQGGVAEFSVLCWIRRTAWEEGTYWNIVDGEGILSFGFDDARDGVLFQLHGTPAELSVLVPFATTARMGRCRSTSGC